VSPEQLDHLIHSMHLSGGLARLSTSQVDSILHALRQAKPAAVPRARKQRHLSIDIVGTCNLRCPSCPVGNMETHNPSGLMKLDLFEQIVRKAIRDYPIEAVYLYNWTEPLLHPQLPAFISFVRGQGLPCGLSSNLNNLRNIDAVIAARPTAFRISLSGFTQQAYGQTHLGGDIERVKRNMAVLSETIRKQGNREVGVHVYFHKYRHNLHEVEPMRKYAESLGFGWQENWAFLQPVEKALDLVEGRLPEEQIRFTHEQYALPLSEAIEASSRFRDSRCEILGDLTIDVKGDLTLCCATYDATRNRLGYFLDMSVEEVAQAKKRHALCSQCVEHGLHLHYRYDHHTALQSIYDGLAQQHTGRLGEQRSGRVELPLVSSPAG
jgi:MoaA/NifB/PqqE/SkfB family radical SAM enzyme